MKDTFLIPSEQIANKIYLFRGKKVMLDKDLAALYGVQTKVLNQAVKRNMDRFPGDFMFELTRDEVKAARSQIVTLQKGGWGNFAFTEQGVAMLSSVLKSKRAVQVNIQIIRTFTRIRELLATNEALHKKVTDMEKKYDERIREIFSLIGHLLEDEKQSKRKIGF